MRVSSAPPSPHHRCRPAGDIGEGVAGDVEGAQEGLPVGVEILPGQRPLVRPGDAVDHKINSRPDVAKPAEHRVQGFGFRDIGVEDQFRTKARGQRQDALPERLPLIGDGQLGAMRGQGPGNPPGDGVVVGHSENQAAPALHGGDGRHRISSAGARRPGRRWCPRSRNCWTSPCRDRRCPCAAGRWARPPPPASAFRYAPMRSRNHVPA